MVGYCPPFFFIVFIQKGCMTELVEMIKQELQELLDMNHGGSYYPPNLDPKVVRLYEKYKKKKNEKHLGKNQKMGK